MRLLLCLICFLPGIKVVLGQTPVEAWTQRYNGPGNRNDLVQAMVVDSMGNVLVTGLSFASPVHPNNWDYATIKYSGTGVPLWTNRYDGPVGDNDVPNAIAVDSNGNVLVTGRSPGPGNGNRDDFATIKYSADGIPLWTNRYNGLPNRSDAATALAVHTNGDVIVTGYSLGTEGDYITIKYSSMGVPLWTNRYNGPANSNDIPAAVALDLAGNAFVTGSSSAGLTRDYLTIKYSPAGVPLWTNRFDGPGHKNDFVRDAAIDSSGNLFVTGEVSDGTNCSYATIKYSPEGILLWTNYYDGPAGANDSPLAAGVDSLGNVVVTGTSARDHPDFDYDYDYATIKYSGAGVPLWTNRYDADTADGAYDLAIDASDNVIVTGDSGPLDYPSDSVTIKYSAAGVPLWVMRYAAREDKSASSMAVGVGPTGVVFVTGHLADGVNADFVTIKYAEVWPIALNVNLFTNGVLEASFTNTPGATFTLLGSTNLSSETGNWTVLGSVSETAPGQFSFTNAPAATDPRVFYRVRSP